MTTAPTHIVRGNTITLTAYYHNNVNVLTDGTGVLVNITNPLGVLVVTNSVAWVHIATGTYTFDYAVPSNALLGTYHIEWSGEVNGDDAEGGEDFIVDPVTATARVCSGWVSVETVRACCTSLPASGEFSDDAVQDAIDTATDLLYTLSGAQWGGSCELKVRPCSRPSCYAGWGGTWLWGGATSLGSSFPNPSDPSSWPPRGCSCDSLPRVDLGYWPITSVTEVKIDGAVVDPATYRVDYQRYLVRVANADGTNDGWPCCQRLDLPDTEESTWSVSFEYGQAPPPAGVNAAKKLACEIAKACAGLICELPGRVTNAVRQGVSFTLMDPSMLDNGLTGLYEVDLFLMAYNPAKTRGLTVIWSPDIGPGSWRAG
jgi:hypothetical protein